MQEHSWTVLQTYDKIVNCSQLKWLGTCNRYKTTSWPVGSLSFLTHSLLIPRYIWTLYEQRDRWVYSTETSGLPQFADHQRFHQSCFHKVPLKHLPPCKVGILKHVFFTCPEDNTSFVHIENDPGHEKMCLMPYANNKGADQPAHPRSLISAFVFAT